MSTEIGELDDVDLSREYAEPVAVNEVLRGTLDSIEEYSKWFFDGERWPRLCYGDRQRITGIKRKLIFERDGRACRNCGRSLLYAEAQIDHIIPWSAWGSDCSCNLRILCEPCNTARSNYRSGLDTAPRPHVATSCTACGPYPVVEGMTHAYCGSCGIIAPTCPELAL